MKGEAGAAARPRESIVDRTFRCGVAARWLPRALGGAVLAASTLVSLEVDSTIVRLLPHVRSLMVITGALLAWVIVRRGEEVRLVFGLARDALWIGGEPDGVRLQFRDIRRLDWAPPFSGSLAWIPAAVVVDRNGKPWRVPALVDEGDAMVRELLARAGRHDLDTWAEVYRVPARMGRYRARVRTGYAIALAVVLAGTLHWAS
jgi:hypothetical protein